MPLVLRVGATGVPGIRLSMLSGPPKKEHERE